MNDVDLPALWTAPLRTVTGGTTDLRCECGEAPIVVVFVRHFGCLFCRERVVHVRGEAAALHAAGAQVVFVGPGTDAMVRDFAATHAAGLPVFGDPELACFRAAGMRRGLGTTLRWRLFRNGMRAWRAGFRQGRVQGDPWQQGGLLVLSPTAGVLHRQVDRVAGDPLDLDAALRSLPQN